jgi:hypothetical protein
MPLYCRRNEVLSFELLAHGFDLLDHCSLRFLIQTVLTTLSALNMTLHILDVKFSLYIGLVYKFLLFLNLEIVFVLLFCGFVFRLSLVLCQFFYFLVQVFFLFAQNFKFRLLAQFNGDVVRKI